MVGLFFPKGKKVHIRDLIAVTNNSIISSKIVPKKVSIYIMKVQSKEYIFHGSTTRNLQSFLSVFPFSKDKSFD